MQLRHWSLWQEQQVVPKHEWIASMSTEDAQALMDLPFSLNLPELGLLVVHAGIVPEGGLLESITLGKACLCLLYDCAML